MEDRFENFTTLVLQFNRYIQKIKALEMKKFNLHASHTMILYLLYKNPNGLTPYELVQLSKEDKAQVSRAMSYLIKEGYITKPNETTNRYKLHYTLTPKGQEVSKEVVSRVDHALLVASQGLSDEKRNSLYESLNIIMKNLSENYDVLDN